MHTQVITSGGPIAYTLTSLLIFTPGLRVDYSEIVRDILLADVLSKMPEYQDCPIPGCEERWDLSNCCCAILLQVHLDRVHSEKKAPSTKVRMAESIPKNEAGPGEMSPEEWQTWTNSWRNWSMAQDPDFDKSLLKK